MIGMPNKEKVIKGLECCSNGVVTPYVATCRFCADCPYGENDIPCTKELARDALALLKEQEPVEPKEIINEQFPVGDYRRTIGWLCGKCGGNLVGDGDYCSYCGQAVKWE